MPFLKSLPERAGPPNLFKRYPEIYKPFSEMSQALMNGPSPLTSGERELILAFAAGLMGCDFVYTAHAEVAYAWGYEPGTLDRLLEDISTAPVEARLRPLLAYVRKLVLTPDELAQEDADTVLAAGWDDHALHDAIAVTARSAFMKTLVMGHGFIPLSRDIAASHAHKRIEHGYLNLYPSFQKAD